MKVIVRFEVHLTDRERAALGVRTRRDVKDDLTRRASALLKAEVADLTWHKDRLEKRMGERG